MGTQQTSSWPEITASLEQYMTALEELKMGRRGLGPATCLRHRAARLSIASGACHWSEGSGCGGDQGVFLMNVKVYKIGQGGEEEYRKNKKRMGDEHGKKIRRKNTL